MPEKDLDLLELQAIRVEFLELILRVRFAGLEGCHVEGLKRVSRGHSRYIPKAGAGEERSCKGRKTKKVV